MRNHQLPPAPAKACEATFEAYFGYGDSETLVCRRPATHRATYVERTPAGEGRVRTLACSAHAEDSPADAFASAVRFYRFRTV